jgi:dissimilatory sulfite reductase related protein
MATLTAAEKTYEVDEDGYLANIDEWDIDVANYYAMVEGIAMSDDHWEVVHYLREFYKEYHIAPMIRVLVRAIERRLGPEKGTNHYIYQLFPDGPAKQACKIAGLPKPTGCV